MAGHSEEPDVVAMVSYNADGEPDQSDGWEQLALDDTDDNDETAAEPKPKRGRPRKAATEEATSR